jgi:hypothetical protein
MAANILEQQEYKSLCNYLPESTGYHIPKHTHLLKAWWKHSEHLYCAKASGFSPRANYTD